MPAQSSPAPACDRCTCPSCDGTDCRPDILLARAVLPSTEPPPVFRDVTLASGRTIKHRRQPNGSQKAYIDGAESDGMTEPEWREYCAVRGFKLSRFVGRFS